MEIARFVPLLILYGLLHGLAYAQEISILELSPHHSIPALFMFNLGIDLGHFAVAVLLAVLQKYWKEMAVLRLFLGYVVGAISLASMVLLFQEHVMTGRTDVLGLETIQSQTQFSLPASPNQQAGGQRPRAAGRLTNPVVNYLSIKPYEVRQEILMQARAAVQFLGADDRGMGGIPVESLEAIKGGILDLFRQNNSIRINGQVSEPVLVRADFVTLGPAGVELREEPVSESLDDGIIGLTLVHETSGLADAITLRWDLFSPQVPQVESTTVDPFGGESMILSSDRNELRWKRRLSGFRVPVVEEIAVEKQRLPLVSLGLFVITLGIILNRGKAVAGRKTLLSLTCIGLTLYPFLRFPVSLPLVSQWTPSPDRTAMILEDLLTNVYLSFEVRNEDDVYDRLAVSVTGNQLTKIYLDSRRSLEFENRGDARASVEEVEILAVDEVQRAEESGFIADTRWTVAGSVSHFGHTHYRRNRYHALVTFDVVRNTWKIRQIELIEEKRLL
jgi:hypothetical protein